MKKFYKKFKQLIGIEPIVKDNIIDLKKFRKKKLKKTNNKGFTLIEMIVVMSIIGVISTLITPTIIDQANMISLKSDIQAAQTIDNAIEMAKLNNNFSIVDGKITADSYGVLAKGNYIDERDLSDEELKLRLDGNILIYSEAEGVQLQVSENYEELTNELDEMLKRWISNGK
ncbi:MAG: hypothetical protein ATN31_04920 [Candidatus Epulonipiscioides saccharophilum]|nr:MAG: hypothetical protein ATN31_04920 [Epulopiscium sp. AS2M-Bin001]